LPVAGQTWTEQQAYHFCDGGFVDNEGMVTVIAWLRHLLETTPAQQRPFDQILLVRLMPFPRNVQPAAAESDRGWFYELLGPIDALQNVRIASQAERNHLAVHQFIDWAGRIGVPAEQAVFHFESAAGATPPLSWMLTDSQKREIERAWQQMVNRGAHGPLGVVDRYF
jgi:hypothetical protein